MSLPSKKLQIGRIYLQDNLLKKHCGKTLQEFSCGTLCRQKIDSTFLFITIAQKLSVQPWGSRKLEDEFE